MCDQCGVPYLRSALRRGRDGLLRCVNDWPGRDELTLAELTANRAAALAQQSGARKAGDGARPDQDGNGPVGTYPENPLLARAGQPSSNSSYTGPVSRRTASDVYNGDVPTTF